MQHEHQRAPPDLRLQCGNLRTRGGQCLCNNMETRKTEGSCSKDSGPMPMDTDGSMYGFPSRETLPRNRALGQSQTVLQRPSKSDSTMTTRKKMSPATISFPIKRTEDEQLQERSPGGLGLLRPHSTEGHFRTVHVASDSIPRRRSAQTSARGKGDPPYERQWMRSSQRSSQQAHSHDESREFAGTLTGSGRALLTQRVPWPLKVENGDMRAQLARAASVSLPVKLAKERFQGAGILRPCSTGCHSQQFRKNKTCSDEPPCERAAARYPPLDEQRAECSQRSFHKTRGHGHNYPSADVELENSEPQFQQIIRNSFPPECRFQSYNMEAEPRGICVIMVNQNFYQDPNNRAARLLSQRNGAHHDQDNFRTAFTELGFLVRSYNDLTDRQMLRILQAIADENHSQFNAFVCCISTHGALGKVYGANGVAVEIRRLTEKFCPQSCETLTGKPKVFFIQACQGSEVQRGYPTWEMDASPDVPLIPNEADFLLAYSTVLGYRSYRCTEEGSVFIKKLVKILREHAHEREIVEILTQATLEVSSMIIETQEGAEKQSPAQYSTLRKKLFFVHPQQRYT